MEKLKFKDLPEQTKQWFTFWLALGLILIAIGLGLLVGIFNYI